MKQDMIDILQLIRSLFKQGRRDPRRFAPSAAPNGWHQVPPGREPAKRGTSTIYQIAGRTFGFTDKPFESEVHVDAELTGADIRELAARNLDPYNAAYAQAKRIFASNTGVTKSDLFEAIPGVSKHTLKDVLAAFRAAQRSPIDEGGGA